MFEDMAGLANIVSGDLLCHKQYRRAVRLKSTDSVDLVLASLDQCIISDIKRTANATKDGHSINTRRRTKRENQNLF